MMSVLRVVSCLLLPGVVLTTCGDNGARVLADPVPTVPAGDAAAVARDLGRGMNFGNILEAPSEGAWGLRLSDDLFDATRAAGAATIRLPVRWSNHALATRPYTIDSTFLARVDYAVDAALSRGMRIVVNMHHYHQLDGDALDAGEFSVDPTVVEERFVAIWRQLATHYRDRPATVLYELYNEPHGSQNAARWNALLSTTLTAVRAIDSTHYIVIGPVSWNSAGELGNLVLPAGDSRLIVTIHSYEPFDFTHQGAAWAGKANSPTVTCCTAAQLGQIAAPFVTAHRWRDTSKRPVWVGEFGSYDHAPYASRVTYTRAVRDSMDAHGMTWAYWEFASGFGIYDQPSRTFRVELRDALFH
jgi:endoglucanase